MVASALVLAACGGGGDDDPAAVHPLVADIAPALAAIDADTDLFQVAGTPGRVELVAQDGADAVGYTYADGELSDGEPLGPASGYTFRPGDVTFDPERVFEGVTGGLDDPLITRFEVLGGPGGVLYSAEVLSKAGGTLAIDLGPDGTVLGAAPVR
ncbi:MAG TPA: hypothetical protein VNQ73_01520 [Ilumatobacter sp.]|nr:hypothetical protein [Ilumatobacter sp.]